MTRNKEKVSTDDKDFEAAQLARLFDGRNRAAFAREFELGSPALLWQYIKADRPLNIEAAIKIARGLGVPIDEFSPRLATLIRGAYPWVAGGREADGPEPTAEVRGDRRMPSGVTYMDRRAANAWPFRNVALERVRRLTPDQLADAEDQLDIVMSRCENKEVARRGARKS